MKEPGEDNKIFYLAIMMGTTFGFILAWVLCSVLYLVPVAL